MECNGCVSNLIVVIETLASVHSVTCLLNRCFPQFRLENNLLVVCEVGSILLQNKRLRNRETSFQTFHISSAVECLNVAELDVPRRGQ